MKIGREKDFEKLFIGRIVAHKKKAQWATIILWLPVIFLQIFVFEANSQSTLEIFVSRNNPSVEIFTFTRVNTISGVQTIDTFRAKGTGKFSLQVFNQGLPGIGWIRSDKENLREVFLAPGFPLELSINTNQVSKSESIKGGWSAVDCAYKTGIKILNEYNSLYPALDAPDQLKLYDRLLKIIDTGIVANHRPLKDFLIYRLMRQAVDSADQILELNEYKMLYLAYQNQLAFGSFRNDIDRRYNYKLNVLTNAVMGKPAPMFKLRDSAGNIHRLEDYKGKLVYIDLWASWCLPCRLETPYMHKIISRYSKRSDIAFIGVALADKMPDWKRAIRQDKPRWLQLHDTNTFVANAYAATSVPRYILIDKAGNVLEFNAPPPSQPAKLIAIIDKELSN